MADRTSREQRQRRTDAREKRRSLAAKPFEELDEAAGAEERESGDGSTVKKAVATALAGAVAAGVAGAAKALAERRSTDETPTEPEEPENSPSTDDEGAEPEPQASDERQSDAEPEEEPDEGEPDHEETPADEHRAAAADGDDDDGDDDRAAADGQPQRGATADELREIVDSAKRELELLLGKEAERVSGFHRSRGGWAVTLEVVEVHRIPETTDVLSSYEVAFDDDRNVVGVSELRRYRRSQIEEHR